MGQTYFGEAEGIVLVEKVHGIGSVAIGGVVASWTVRVVGTVKWL